LVIIDIITTDTGIAKTISTVNRDREKSKIILCTFCTNVPFMILFRWMNLRPNPIEQVSKARNGNSEYPRVVPYKFPNLLQKDHYPFETIEGLKFSLK